MKIQLEVLTVKRDVVCRECDLMERQDRPKLYHPKVEIYIRRGPSDGERFMSDALQAVMNKLQELGLGVRDLSYDVEPPRSRKRKPVDPKQLRLLDD